MISRPAIILAVAMAASLACSDELAGGAADAGADAAVAVAAADAGVDAGPDAGVDAAPDAGVDSAADGPADSAADAMADATSDLARRGILSVPADDPDVTVTEVTFTSDHEVHAYLAVPSRIGTFAGLVLVPGEDGLTEHVRDVARRLAKTGGCVALAPDLGTRSAEALLADLSAALEALARQPQVGANRLGAIGFGAGGTRALRFAGANARVRAVVAYYAPTPMPADALKTTSASVLGQYGMSDDATNAGIAELERVLKEAGRTFEKRFYAAGAGFNDDSASTYDEAAAVAAWPYTVGWMEMYLN